MGWCEDTTSAGSQATGQSKEQDQYNSFINFNFSLLFCDGTVAIWGETTFLLLKTYEKGHIFDFK